MTKEKRSLFMRFILGFVILVGLDQWTKGLAVAHLKENSPFELIPEYLSFIILKTEGQLFGMLQEKQLFFFSLSQWLF